MWDTKKRTVWICVRVKLWFSVVWPTIIVCAPLQHTVIEGRNCPFLVGTVCVWLRGVMVWQHDYESPPADFHLQPCDAAELWFCSCQAELGCYSVDLLILRTIWATFWTSKRCVGGVRFGTVNGVSCNGVPLRKKYPVGGPPCSPSTCVLSGLLGDDWRGLTGL